MNTIKLYHGTKHRSITDVMDSPKASNAINGFGFYVTKQLHVAKQYGRVICFEISVELANQLNLRERPIDQRFTEDQSLLNECIEGGLEIVLTQRQADELALEAEDVYLV